MSKAKQIFSAILAAVSEETEVPVAEIVSKSRVAEAVEARHICVKLLWGKGVRVSKIAELMGVTPRSVQWVLSDFDDRIAYNRPMRNNYESLAKKLGSN